MPHAVSVPFFSFLLLLGSVLPAGASASLVADVNRFESLDLPPAVRGPLVPLGNKVLFRAWEPGSGYELWVSDGTSLGTQMLRDFCPGGCSPDLGFLGTVRNRIALFAVDVHSEPQIWVSDGTRSGTFALTADGVPSLSSCARRGELPVSLGDALFFFGEDSGSCRLWRTDGTPSGTRAVSFVEPQSLTRAGDRLFFLAFASEGQALWVSDGTSGGTRQLSTWEGEPRILAAVGSKLLFIAPQTGEELWVSDGTAGGTKPITGFAAPEPFRVTGPARVFDGVAYFLVDDVTGGVDLWRSDGTQAGTKRVTNFGYATPFPEDAELLPLVKAGSRLVFVADDGLTGARLWSSRGTPETTAAVGCPGGCPFLNPSAELAVLGDRVVFGARGTREGQELWSTDAAATSIHLVKDLCPGCNSRPEAFTVIDGSLFFVASGDDAVGIWKTDGTAPGTFRLATLGQGNAFGAEDFHLVRAGRNFFFAAESEGRPLQLWTSDGTPAGSAPVTVIGIGDGSSPSSFAVLGNRVFFVACSDFVQNLWQSDGTAAGTVPVTPALARNCTNNPGDIEGLTASGGLVYFRDRDVLWRTDGTPAGTLQLTEELNDLGDLVAFQGGVVFPLWDGNQFSLWASDGTAVGTRQLFEWPQGTLSLLGASGFGLLFSSSPDGSDPLQLLATDGTTGGTHVIAALEGVSRTLPPMVRVGTRVYFLAEGSSGPEIWSTDGTADGTGKLQLPDEAGAREPLSLAELGGALYFLATVDPGEEEDLLELWRTDGTPAGSSRVRVLAPREELPGRLVAAGGRLFFSANDGGHGVELWESDGTAEGTRMVEDLAPGESSSHPVELSPAGDRLYFAADDGVHGLEPWVLPLAGAACQPTAEVLCLGGGRFKVEAAWRDFEGHSGQGHAVSLTADTGTFWFFDPANVEVIVKVLDGRGVNGHHWVFYGALSTVRYILTVTDTQTGAARRYINPPSRLGSVGDTNAFGPLGATGSGLSVGPEAAVFEPIVVAGKAARDKAPCVASATRLCLGGGRFAVEARWKDFDGNVGDGKAVPLAGGDTGYFWFFGADNVEVVLKVLDGRPVNGKFWVFYGALSSVEYTLTVTDTETGAVKTYENPAGRLGSVADTGAF